MRWRTVLLVGAAAVAAAGCSHGPGGPTGTVTGTYIRVGGAAAAPNVPLSGIISFRGPSGSTVSFSSGSDGKFSGQLPPGTYTVSATSSQINDGKSACYSPLTTRVQVNKTTTVTVICAIP